MEKKVFNNKYQPGKKIFIGGKVYDLSVMDKCTVEASVQAYLDGTVGKDKVRFELYTIGNTVAMFFHRGFDYTAYHVNRVKYIMDADAFMMTGHEYNKFWMPCPFPLIPGCVYPYPYQIVQGDFLDAYRKSAQILGGSRIKDAWLDISSLSVVLRVQFG